MSGGFFNYDQSRIRNIIDSIEDLIEKNGRPKTEQELKDGSWGYNNYKEYYEIYPGERFCHRDPDEVIEEFKNGLTYLKISYVYAKGIDFLVSGDDGNESFLKRLEKELSDIEK